MSALVIAVDPGPTHSGIVARAGDTLVDWTVLTRSGGLAGYAERVAEQIGLMLDDCDTDHGYDTSVLAVEGYNPPTPQAGTVSPVQVAETAWLTGYLYESCRAMQWLARGLWGEAVVLVPPNKHGRCLLGAYPEELVTEGERRGNWRVRPAGRSTEVSHARSAWDVSRAAPAQLRIAEVDG